MQEVLFQTESPTAVHGRVEFYDLSLLHEKQEGRTVAMVRESHGWWDNESKSAVARPQSRKFLGYSFWYAKGGAVKRRVAPEALEAMKQRVRQITDRNGGRSMLTVFAELRDYLTGWKQFFRLAETPGTFGDLDSWIRHRLRMVQLKQWKRGRTIYREAKRLGANQDAALQAARASRRWWWNSSKLLHVALSDAYYDRNGVPRLAA